MKNLIFFLRLSLGWLFIYAGAIKIFDPKWSADFYLKGAQSFSGFYHWLALPANIGWVNLLNEWGLFLVGLFIMIGLFVRYASVAGIVIMALYYFPTLHFPFVGDYSFIIDEHIIYIICFCILFTANAGMYKGLDGRKN